MKASAQGQPANGSWKGIALSLRHAIEAGELEVGAQMPTEPALMKQFRATRYSIRRALSALQSDGLIRIEQGRGTFVHEGYLVSYRLGERPRFTNVLLENHITPGQEILAIETVPLDGEIATALGLRRPGKALRMELLGYADGQVVKHDTNYFPLPRFKGFEARLRAAGSVTEALAATGIVDYRRARTSIVGRLPTPSEARLLRQLPSQPVFECFRVDVDAQSRPILAGRTLFSCERVRLVLAGPNEPC
jgi:GntR family phosphonate transport system transcriptional regulator